MKTFKTIKFTVLALFSACILIACSNEKLEDKTDNEVIDMHSSDISIDWEGNYYGEMPCDSCSGIKTSITLKDDGSYEKVEEFLGKDDAPKITKGKIKWSDDKSKILLDNRSYFLAENSLIQLNANGKEIAEKLKDRYVLNKSEQEHALSENNQTLTYTYKGSDGNNYQVIFNTNITPPTALIQTVNKAVVELLTQTEASAKTALYKNDNASLDISGDTGTLKRKGKTIKLHIAQ